MDLFSVIAILITLTALFSYLNHRYIHLHPSVGVMVLALALSLGLMLANSLGLGVKPFVAEFLRHVHFDRALLQWMLGFLLFAGGLSVDLNQLLRERRATAALSVVATIVSMFIVGGLIWISGRGLGLDLPLGYCLLFGALISPTDPVAVVSLMKTSGAPPWLETIISAESLFNDGIGVVLFLTVAGVVSGEHSATAGSVIWLFIRQSLGGAILGFVCGGLVYQLLKRVVSFQVEVLLTLALVMGGFALAQAIGVSAPITAVVAGLLIGNRGGMFNVCQDTHDDLAKFWELIEEILNALLFVLIGLEMLVIAPRVKFMAAVLMVIPIVLAARWLSVTATLSVVPSRGGLRRAMIPILTWGGLRGGLAVAMALSLPPSPYRQTIFTLTYGVVLFSIIVQGTTVKWLVKRYIGPGKPIVAGSLAAD